MKDSLTSVATVSGPDEANPLVEVPALCYTRDQSEQLLQFTRFRRLNTKTVREDTPRLRRKIHQESLTKLLDGGMVLEARGGGEGLRGWGHGGLCSFMTSGRENPPLLSKCWNGHPPVDPFRCTTICRKGNVNRSTDCVSS